MNEQNTLSSGAVIEKNYKEKGFSDESVNQSASNNPRSKTYTPSVSLKDKYAVPTAQNKSGNNLSSYQFAAPYKSPAQPPVQNKSGNNLSSNQFAAPYQPPTVQNKSGNNLSSNQSSATAQPPVQNKSGNNLFSNQYSAPYQPPAQNKSGDNSSSNQSSAPYQPPAQPPVQNKSGSNFSSNQYSAPYQPPSQPTNPTPKSSIYSNSPFIAKSQSIPLDAYNSSGKIYSGSSGLHNSFSATSLKSQNNLSTSRNQITPPSGSMQTIQRRASDFNGFRSRGHAVACWGLGKLVVVGVLRQKRVMVIDGAQKESDKSYPGSVQVLDVSSIIKSDILSLFPGPLAGSKSKVKKKDVVKLIDDRLVIEKGLFDSSVVQSISKDEKAQLESIELESSVLKLKLLKLMVESDGILLNGYNSL